MSNIAFSLVKVSKGITQKPFYRAVVQSNGVVETDELAELMATRTKQEASLFRYFLNVLSEELETQLLEGRKVKLGRLEMNLAIRGTFTSEDEEFDSAKHKLATVVRALNPFRGTMAAVVPENVTAGLTCTVSSAMDEGTKRLLEITGSNRLLIQGQRLGVSPDNPDEGVWLADPKTGDVVATAVVERSDSQTIDCAFPKPPAPGVYTLVVSCRNDARESLRPAVAKIKNFKVLSASTEEV